MNPEQIPYQAFLLRIWCVEARGRRSWRATLQCVDTGKRWGFDELDALLDFLKEQMVEQGRIGPAT